MLKQISSITIDKFYNDHSDLVTIEFTVRAKDQYPESPSTRLTYSVNTNQWSGKFIKFNNPDIPMRDFEVDRLVFAYGLKDRVEEILDEEMITMEFTMQVSSNATSKAAAYTDILQQTIAHIVKDESLNPYELASVSKFTKTLSMWMDEEASKRQSPIANRNGVK